MPPVTVTSPQGRKFELREVAVPGLDGRSWEVVEPKTGLRFDATLYRFILQEVVEGLDRGVAGEEVLRAVAHAVDKAAAAFSGDETRGVCELRVSGLEVLEAVEMSQPSR